MDSQSKETIEIRPNEFEEVHPNTVKAYGENAGFFHSLGRAIGGEKVDNKFLKSSTSITTKKE